MAILDYRCDDCNEVMVDLLVGTLQHYPAPTECASCKSPNIRRLYSFRGHISKTTFDDEGTRAMHMQHKKWVEDLAKKGELIECKERGPLEYRPQFERKYR